MMVLIGCEFSQIVTKSFRDRGHEAFSCDVLSTEGNPAYHFQTDIRDILYDRHWDLAIFHPPCTHLAVSGATYFAEKEKDGRQQAALDFVKILFDAPIRRIAIENPISIISTKIRKPDQIIQPYWFGDPYQKATCLWLKGLVRLKPTNIVAGREQKCLAESPGPDRWKRRSRTYQGIADAMASQWGVREGWQYIQRNF